MPRRTKAQIGAILADFDAARTDYLKAEKRQKQLKAEIKAMNLVDGTTYGDMAYSLDNPREIMDQPVIVEIMTALAESPEIVALAKRLKLPAPRVPMKFTDPSIKVKPVVK